MGATTAIYSVLDAILLRPLPYKRPTRRVGLHHEGADESSNRRAEFELPQDVRQRLIATRARIADLLLGSTDRPIRELAPGIVKVPGRFEIVEVNQDDGVVIIEASRARRRPSAVRTSA